MTVKEPCRLCHNNLNNQIHEARENMYGFKGVFDYLECGNCGALQILHIPENLAEYYPDNFYSFKPGRKKFKGMVKEKVYLYRVLGKGIVGKAIYSAFKKKYRFHHSNLESIARLYDQTGVSIKRDYKILDVGCGSGGTFLIPMKSMGFYRLTGIDPYIEKTINRGGVTIKKATLDEYQQTKRFDLICMFHVFEHLAEHKKVLNNVRRLLAKNRICILSMPVKSEYIWERYHTDWIDLDAPRHLIIHTLKSFKKLVEQAGFTLRGYYFDSSAEQFWASEQNKQGIPYMSAGSMAINAKNSMFSRAELVEFQNLSEELNKKEEGSRAIFYLS